MATHLEQRPAEALACRMCGAEPVRDEGSVDGYRFVTCARCGFTFSPAITGEELPRLYAEGYHGPAEGAPAYGWAPDDARWLDPAFRLLGDGAHRLLEFGAGQSHTAEVLRARGHRVVAVDLAPPLRPHPDRVTGDILELDLPLAGFDLVYSYQVFEHLPEPRPVLERLLELTRPGGLVFTHTDMETSGRGDGLRDWWYVLPPDHCAFYVNRTFEVFCEGTSHEVVWRSPKVVVIRRG